MNRSSGESGAYNSANTEMQNERNPQKETKKHEHEEKKLEDDIQLVSCGGGKTSPMYCTERTSKARKEKAPRSTGSGHLGKKPTKERGTQFESTTHKKKAKESRALIDSLQEMEKPEKTCMSSYDARRRIDRRREWKSLYEKEHSVRAESKKKNIRR